MQQCSQKINVEPAGATTLWIKEGSFLTALIIDSSSHIDLWLPATTAVPPSSSPISVKFVIAFTKVQWKSPLS